MTRIRRITATISWNSSPDLAPEDEEEAIQTLAEAVCDDGAVVTFDYFEENV